MNPWLGELRSHMGTAGTKKEKKHVAENNGKDDRLLKNTLNVYQKDKKVKMIR